MGYKNIVTPTKIKFDFHKSPIMYNLVFIYSCEL